MIGPSIRRLVAVVSIMLFALPSALGASQVSSASPPESVFFTPEESRARPGETISLELQAVSTVSPPLLEVTIPAGLHLTGQPTCNAHALLDPVGASNASARPTELYCDGEIPTTLDGSTLVRVESGSSYQSILTYNLFLDFEVVVPLDAEPGMLFEITAPLAGLSEKAERATVEVLSQDGRRITPLKTPAPAATTLVTPPVNDSPLWLYPNVLQAQPGETVEIGIHIPRSAFWDMQNQGMDTYALLIFVQQATVLNFPESSIDLRGSAACSQGTDGDPEPPMSRAFPSGTALPHTLMTTVNPDVPPGTTLHVCVELVGLSGATELFSWNAFGVIVVN